jgi:hypothetical protein
MIRAARSRQAAANLEWAAKELAAEGLHSDVTLAKVVLDCHLLFFV